MSCLTSKLMPLKIRIYIVIHRNIFQYRIFIATNYNVCLYFYFIIFRIRIAIPSYIIIIIKNNYREQWNWAK